MLSPSFCEKYMYKGNEGSYPFTIPGDADASIEKLLELSEAHISQHFNGSWVPYNLCSRTKPTAYRSVCWLDMIRYTLHTLVAPYLSDVAAKALAAVVRGITTMLSRNLDEADIKEMEK